MAKIIFTDGPYAGKELELQDKDIVMGRRDDCDLMLDDDLTSSHHARLHIENGNWKLTDLNSTNGTVVNTEKINSVVLHDNDVIQIGHIHATFTLTDKHEVTEKSNKPAAASSPVSPGTTDEDLAIVDKMQEYTDLIRHEVAKVIIGQQEVLNQVLMCMIANGHALLIGMPGMAKTLMVSTIAKVLDLKFKRIQFTPDLMPTDITGTDVLETNKETNEKEFKFVQGPIFCNLLLADEINRTPPKTQAALLEAMQEKRVTAGSNTYTLDAPFFVLATQNPIEQEGTYPLPEAQMDRFMFNIWVDYPLEHEEEEIVTVTTVNQSIQPEKALSKEKVLQLQQVVRKIPVSEHVIKYSIRLVRASRPGNEKSPDFIKEYVSVGAGPRAGQYLIMAAKARAVLEGRIHVSCNDIKNAAIPVMRHRMYTNFAADSEGLTSMDLVKKLLDAVEEPSEDDYK